jgi:hypothetical protein
MPGRTTRMVKDYPPSRSKGPPTRLEKRETVTEVMSNDYCLLLSTMIQLEVERAYVRRTVQADIDGVANVMLGSPTDVIIAVSVEGVLSRVGLSP